MQRGFWLILLGFLALPAQANQPFLPAPGLRVTANGFAALQVDETTAKVSGFWPHLYAHRAPGLTTPNLLYDAYFGLKIAQKPAVWVNSLPPPQNGPEKFGYVPGTGVVQDPRILDDILVTTRTFAPMSLQLPGAVMLLEVKNTGKTAQTVTVAALGNFHLGPGETPTLEGESIQALGQNALVEMDEQSLHRVLYLALGPTPSALETTNPYAKWLNTQEFSAVASQPGPDRVAGMQWPSVTLQPGQSQHFGWLLLYGEGTDVSQFETVSALWLDGRTPSQLLEDELAEWKTWHSQTKLPKNPQLPQQLAQNLAMLRMAQVHEPDLGPPGQNLTPHGQIVASLPPGIWHITWLRDQAYAGVALAASGHVQEAQAALDFVLHGQVGGYEKYLNGPYLLTPVRYFGGGLEEADSDQNGPNIELDGLGLFLWQAGRYVQASQNLQWLQSAWPQLRDLVAEKIVKLRDPTGLVTKDSGIWEVHWNGQQKHFANTTILGVRGLCAAAELAEMQGLTQQAWQWRQVAQAMQKALVTHLVGADHVLRGNLEETPAQALDVAVVEAFLDGQLPVDGPVALATWQAWQQKLLADGGPGLMRNDDGGPYDSAEWLFIDVRVTRMLERMQAAGVNVDPQPLQQRLAEVVKAGGGVVPELLASQGKTSGQFDGALPMIGFGAAAMALWQGGAEWDDDVTACLMATAPVAEPDAEVAEADAEVAESGEDVGQADDAIEIEASSDVAVSDEISVDAETGGILADGGVDVSATSPAPRSASGCQAGGGASGGIWAFLLAACALARQRSTSKAR